MFGTKFGKVTTIVMIILILAIIVGIGVMGYSIISETGGFNSASQSTEQSSAAGGASGKHGSSIVVADDNVLDSNSSSDIIDGNSVYNPDGNQTDGNSTGNTVKKEMLGGYEVVGILRVPSIKLNLKVLSEVTKKSLETSIALMYTERGLNEAGNTVIIGHNYKNGKLFSNNDKIKVGDAIYLKDKTGTELKYKVSETFEAKANDSSFYTSNGSDKKTLILSTCTDDASETEMRTIVRAEAVE